LPKPLILNAPIRPFDRRSDAPPISVRNEIHREHRNQCRGDDDIAHPVEMPASKPQKHSDRGGLGSTGKVVLGVATPAVAGIPHFFLGLPKTSNGAIEGWMVASLE